MNLTQFYKLKRDRDSLDTKIRLGQKDYCKNFRENHRGWILSLDMLMIACILFNIGALVITNMLVVKEVPDIEFVEMNPVAGEVQGFKTAPTNVAIVFLVMVVKQCIAWSVLIGCYVYLRQTNKTSREFWYLTFFMIFITFFLGYDFFNDFGFLIGNLIWGIV